MSAHKFTAGFASLSLGLALSASTALAASVDVDLSVLNDGGYGMTASGGTIDGLRMPGAAMPRSEYVGPPVTVVAPEPAPEPEPVAIEEPEAPEPEPVAEPLPEAPAIAEAPEPTPPAEPVALPEPVVETAEASASSGSESAIAEPPPPEPALLEPEVPAAEPEPVAPEPEPAAETASLGDAATADLTRIVFDADETRMPDAAADQLSAIASRANADDSLRIQLKAYAGGDDLSASKARRLSLSRALAVRSFLIEQGVRSTRIDVRALGDKVEDEPVNRVDITLGSQ